MQDEGAHGQGDQDAGIHHEGPMVSGSADQSALVWDMAPEPSALPRPLADRQGPRRGLREPARGDGLRRRHGPPMGSRRPGVHGRARRPRGQRDHGPRQIRQEHVDQWIRGLHHEVVELGVARVRRSMDTPTASCRSSPSSRRTRTPFAGAPAPRRSPSLRASRPSPGQARSAWPGVASPCLA
ncbi:unnamed protein product [Prorocentrum cordatum]|uniref:Uncharacterized protein n=1 Tax=Prorocentrum cordatum TaxID=2364126 RepID=A0ABN9VY35_9DINO|nr:unnamed protein product [Polarella glacialis]